MCFIGKALTCFEFNAISRLSKTLLLKNTCENIVLVVTAPIRPFAHSPAVQSYEPSKAKSSCCSLRPRTTPLPDEKSILG